MKSTIEKMEEIETSTIWTTPSTQDNRSSYLFEMLGDGGVVTSAGTPLNASYNVTGQFQYIASTRVHPSTDIHRISTNLAQFPLNFYGHPMGYSNEQSLLPLPGNHHFDPVASTSEEIGQGSSMGTMRGHVLAQDLGHQATATDSASHITNVLMLYEMGNEDKEYTKKAIESLVKKLKDKRPELDNLIMAITSSGKTPTSCVTIQRSLDGRLQVAGRKGVPHVVYARIWRWPSVSKAELQKLPCCAVASDNQDFICINPYHYERVVANAYDQRLEVKIPTENGQSLSIDSIHHPYLQIPYMAVSDWEYMAAARVDHSLSGSFTVTPTPSQNQTPSFASNMGAPQMIVNQIEPVPMDVQYQDWPMSGNFPSIGYSHMTHMTSTHSQQPPPQMSQQMPLADLSMVQIPPMLLGPFPKYWATITYYELDTQVGEPFKAQSSVETREVLIDGGMDPLGDRQGRFCLGAISNVHRTEASEKARLHVGQGIRLWWHEEQLWMIVRSEKAIFVRSPYLDYCEGKPLGSTVHRFTNYTSNENGAIKLYDLRWAYHQMREQTTCERNAVVQQAAAVAGFAPPPSGLGSIPLSELSLVSGADEMQRAFCTIGIAFVKGWGTGYNRNTIKDTPCWVDVQLNRPLQILNALLKEGFK